MEKKKEQKSTGTRPQWSNLPHDIILLISSNFKLPSSLVDMANMERVCSSWRKAMKNRTKRAYVVLSSKPRKKLTKKYLRHIGGDIQMEDLKSNYGELTMENVMISYGEKPKKSVVRRYCRQIHKQTVINNQFFLFSIDDKKKNESPWSAEGSSSLCRVIASHPNGWVVLSDESRIAYLFHLFCQIRIQLPNMMLDTNGRVVQFRVYDIIKAIFSADDITHREDFIVVVSYCGLVEAGLAFWRHSDRNWRCFGGDEFHVVDIGICENTIYAITGGGPYYLESWDLKTNSAKKKLSVPIKVSATNYVRYQRLIVSSEDEVFLVNFDSKSVYKFDSNKKECSEVYSLNGRTLFSSFGDPVIVSAIDAQRLGFRPDAIYLTEKQRRRRQHCIKLNIYSFDDSRGTPIWNLKETCCYFGRNRLLQLQPVGLFFLST